MGYTVIIQIAQIPKTIQRILEFPPKLLVILSNNTVRGCYHTHSGYNHRTNHAMFSLNALDPMAPAHGMVFGSQKPSTENATIHCTPSVGIISYAIVGAPSTRSTTA